MATLTPSLIVHDDVRGVRVRLHAFLARRVESPEVADDLTQEVLLRLVQHPDVPVDSLMAWLYRVAWNVLIDHYRTRRSLARLDANLVHRDLAEDPFAEDPQAPLRELAGCLRSLVGHLPEPYRSAVSAVDLDGRTHNEVARAVNLSVSGVKSRVQRGRRQLQRLLTECCRVHITPSGSLSGYEPITGCEPDPTGGGLRCRGLASAATE